MTPPQRKKRGVWVVEFKAPGTKVWIPHAMKRTKREATSYLGADEVNPSFRVIRYDAQRKKRTVLKIEIAWSRRVAKVTSLTGGHVAQCLDLGDKMEIEISEGRKKRKGSQR